MTATARGFICGLVCGFLIVAIAGKAHRISAHPKTLEGKLKVAKLQLAHDRQQHRVRVLTNHWVSRDSAYVRRLELLLASPTEIICRIFGPYCSQALRVARCESHLHTGAQNGQYLGLFQMGSYARSRYGHGSDALTQSRAAWRYFMDTNATWGPWSCKP